MGAVRQGLCDGVSQWAFEGFDSAGIYAREFVQRMQTNIDATPTVHCRHSPPSALFPSCYLKLNLHTRDMHDSTHKHTHQHGGRTENRHGTTTT